MAWAGSKSEDEKSTQTHAHDGNSWADTFIWCSLSAPFTDGLKEVCQGMKDSPGRFLRPKATRWINLLSRVPARLLGKSLEEGKGKSESAKTLFKRGGINKVPKGQEVIRMSSWVGYLFHKTRLSSYQYTKMWDKMPLVNEESNTAKIASSFVVDASSSGNGFHKPVIMYYSSVSRAQGANAVKWYLLEVLRLWAPGWLSC